MDKLQYDSEIVRLYVIATPISEICEITGASKEYVKRIVTNDMKHERVLRQRKKYRMRKGQKRETSMKTYSQRKQSRIETARTWNERILSAIQIEAPYVVKMMRYERGCIAAEGMERFPSFVDLIRLWQSCGGSTTSDFVNEDDFRESIVHGRVINGMEYKAGEFIIERHTNEMPQYCDLLR